MRIGLKGTIFVAIVEFFVGALFVFVTSADQLFESGGAEGVIALKTGYYKSLNFL